MKKILGSFFVLTLFLFGGNYEIEISKRSAFIKEPLLLRLKLFEKEKDKIVWIKFEPKRSENYEIHLLKKLSTSKGYENLFLIFPLKSGKIEMNFTLKIKKASTQEIEENFLGTGDEQLKLVEGKVYQYNIKPLILNIKNAKGDLFGDFSLDLKVDKKSIKEYEPLYATLTLKGVGYPGDLNISLKTDKSVKILKDKPQKEIKYSKNGAFVSYIFRYALIGEKDYHILPIKLKEFNFKEYKILKTPLIGIKVVKDKNLLDKKEEPKRIEPVFDDFVVFFKYFFVFISGSVFGVLLLILLWERYRDVFKILFSKDKEELFKILVLNYPNRFEDIKDLLNEKISKKEKINLFKIKMRILKEKSNDISKNKR